MILNIVLSMNAKDIVIIRPIVRYPVNNVNAYPMSTTNTTYVVTSPAVYPVATQQTVYQMPVATYPNNNMNNGAVVYQTHGYPAMQQQQQQPVYYAQTNPPAYTTSNNPAVY